MAGCSDGLVDRFVRSSTRFQEKLLGVRADQWTLPTPCTEWDVRALVNHMTQGNLNYVRLLDGGTRAEFLRLREVDAVGTDPVTAYAQSVQECAAAFAAPGALVRILDYPLGRIAGEQALAVRIGDGVVHTWDLARAIGVDDTLDADLVGWVEDHLDEIYAGLAESPVAPDTTHRFFAAPPQEPRPEATRQHRLLLRMGRKP
jgi:uncharacterized protein (TIGR03086 family)